MDSEQKEYNPFELLDSSGIGCIGIDGKGRITHTNSSLPKYLDLDPDGIRGRDIEILKDAIPSSEFWEAESTRGTFYFLAPGNSNLLLIVARKIHVPSIDNLERALLIRPYSLEREFIRMRSRLNQNIAFEIGARLQSMSVASDIILQPELQDDTSTRDRFMTVFNQDLSDLNLLFAQLEETAAARPAPPYIKRSSLDWRSLVGDLLVKVQGLASERNVSLSIETEPLPSFSGDYQWLFLALFGVLHNVITDAPPLSEVILNCRENDNSLETLISVPRT